MASDRSWTIPHELQPVAGHYAFDLDRALAAVVALQSIVPDAAFTAETLGTERMGHGVVIRDNGLVLTIGYLIVEAETIWIRTNEGRVVQGHPLAYDQESGFGLVQALGTLGTPVLPIGRSRDVAVGDRIITAAAGGRGKAMAGHVVARHEFAGYWEYVLDDALFTAPAHPNWGGTAVIDDDGALIGIGSLQLESPGAPDGATQLNMVVPIDLLSTVFDDLIRSGRRRTPARPWLGLYAADVEEKVVVAGTSDDGPAERAGLLGGDVLLAVAGRRIHGLAGLWRSVWGVGSAGAEIPLLVFRDGKTFECRVQSVDRTLFTRARVLH
jgi:S1-C subfamily serine protease